ncbi:MAG TPA: hypothetical protein VNO30_46895 [Kofleriaceae bacterium]|nr:hypothetical protein [Kofleriaceae bacterium]
MLALAVSVGYVAWDSPGAYAQDDEDEGGGDDDDGGGGDDDGGGGGGDDDSDSDDKDQPAITAGGLFTMKSYPIRELERPLTITQKLTQARLGLGTDISNKGAFESVGLSLEGVHGYTDNFMLVGGLTSAYNFQQFNIYGGFEGALAYDLLDIRLAARIGRAAANVSTDPEMVDYQGGATKFSVDIGFPFRYVARPEIAIIALNTLMSIDFNGDAGNGAKPDLRPSLGIATNPVAPLSVVLFATLQVVDFDFTNNIVVPATARVQYSPSRKFDLGLEFTFLNMKPKEEGKKFYDDRFLSLFFTGRVGK